MFSDSREITTLGSHCESCKAADDKGRHGRTSNAILAIVGSALFLWVIVHSGASAIMHQLEALRIALPIVVTLSLVRLLLQTLAWAAALKTEGVHVPMRRLMGVRLASQGMGYLTVFGPVLSEPMKIKLLRTPAAPTVTATFLDNGVYWFTSALIGIAGCACISSMKAQAGTSAVAMSIVFGLVIVFIAKRKSLLSSISAALGKRSPSWLAKAAKAESTIRKLRLQRPQLVGQMLWLDLVCQFLLVAEVAVVLWAVRIPFHWMTVVAIEGLTRAVKMMTGFVPARLGADESGAMSAFAVSGLTPTLGLTLAIARRARDLSWALAGLAWLAWKSEVPQQNNTDAQELFKEETLLCRSLS